MDYYKPGGFDIFKTLNWDVTPGKGMYAYGLLLTWLVAVVFLILAWLQANDPVDTEKQKKFNNYSAVVLLSLILCIYLGTVVCA